MMRVCMVLARLTPKRFQRIHVIWVRDLNISELIIPALFFTSVLPCTGVARLRLFSTNAHNIQHTTIARGRDLQGKRCEELNLHNNIHFSECLSPKHIYKCSLLCAPLSSERNSYIATQIARSLVYSDLIHVAHGLHLLGGELALLGVGTTLALKQGLQVASIGEPSKDVHNSVSHQLKRWRNNPWI